MLKNQGITIRDIAANLRRYENKGHVFFRGYRTAEHETPYAAGYIVTDLLLEGERSYCEEANQ